jgi:hypothetical protein
MSPPPAPSARGRKQFHAARIRNSQFLMIENLAERVGVEPTSPVLPGYPLSRRALSTTQTPLRRSSLILSETCRQGNARQSTLCAADRSFSASQQMNRQERRDTLAILGVGGAKPGGQFPFLQPDHKESEHPPNRQNKPQ